MAIRFYDNAIIDKIKRWVRDPKMTVYGPQDLSNLIQIVGDESNDHSLDLPLIAISRTSSEILNTSKRALTYDGGHVAANRKTSQVLNGIPIKLTYQLDIYTRWFAEADEYMRNFVFNMINYPVVRIEIPYNDSRVEHDSTIILNSSIEDNSSVQERPIHGQFTRLTLSFQ